jgi:hypothetical protein
MKNKRETLNAKKYKKILTVGPHWGPPMTKVLYARRSKKVELF